MFCGMVCNIKITETRLFALVFHEMHLNHDILQILYLIKFDMFLHIKICILFFVFSMIGLMYEYSAWYISSSYSRHQIYPIFHISRRKKSYKCYNKILTSYDQKKIQNWILRVRFDEFFEETWGFNWGKGSCTGCTNWCSWIIWQPSFARIK